MKYIQSYENILSKLFKKKDKQKQSKFKVGDIVKSISPNIDTRITLDLLLNIVTCHQMILEMWLMKS